MIDAKEANKRSTENSEKLNTEWVESYCDTLIKEAINDGSNSAVLSFQRLDDLRTAHSILQKNGYSTISLGSSKVEGEDAYSILAMW